MKNFIRQAMITAVSLPFLIGGYGPVPVRAADATPRIEVSFVLDTTGSMGQLIGGAKQKIWTIARQVVAGRPTPAIKLGLIGFRDRGDQYITKVFDLSDDIDAVYGHLMDFQVGGGGDTPESVNQALNEAVTKISWSKDPNTLKLIFLVGDAPPHMDYPDDVKYPETVRLAREAGIVIIAVQCGTYAATTPVWQEIAGTSGGGFVQIDQSGGMTRTSTPVDAQLTRLGTELNRTVVPYGNAARQSEVRTKGSLAAGADVDRLVYLNVDRAEFGAKVVVTGDGELIWDVVNHKVKLEEIPDSDLPVQLKPMTMEARKDFVEQQFAKRKELQLKVDELSRQRDEFIKADMEKKIAAGNGDSFDAKVAEMIQAQALRRGIQYNITAAGVSPEKK
jgi:von Willebrand factor type A domain-containing protein